MTAQAARASREPPLELADIQGNILAGFNKDHQVLVALTIRDVDATRLWLGRLVPFISTTAEVYQFNRLFSQMRARIGHDPPGLVVTWVHVAFSRDGLALLTSEAEADAVPDVAFRVGMPDRASGLGDPTPEGTTDPTRDWVVGGKGRVPHVLLIVAGDDRSHLVQMLARVRPQSAEGIESVWEEEGATRPDLPGHEHFGFKDGVSQPGVRGLVSSNPRVYFTRRLLAAGPQEQDVVEFAAPGQPLISPGQFVFGYPAQSRATGKPLRVPPLQPTWLSNGSLLVFRRLTQDVKAFKAFVQQTARTVSQTSGFQDVTDARLGALLVGRWPSGAPLSRTPAADISELGTDGLANNDFLFTIDTAPPHFRSPQGRQPERFPPAHNDASGFVCPHGAHIRKVNPRDQDTDLGDQFDTLTRRILRRGIPFGPPLGTGSSDDNRERGLHFLCYQTSIVEQFEKLQSDWANSDNNPRPGGYDLIIGQDREEPRDFELVTADGASAKFTAPQQFVSPTGGGYFFAPSISALRDVLSHTGEVL